MFYHQCWCYHHRCSEDQKGSFVILNAVKNLIQLTGKRRIVRQLYSRIRFFALAQNDKK